MKSDSGLPAFFDDTKEIRARVALLEFLQDAVVQRLDRGNDEQASRLPQRPQQFDILQKMLHLDRHVIGERGEFAMQRIHQRNGVSHSIEEIRIAKRDVLRAGGHLLPNVRKHHLPVDDAEHTVVYRHNRTMPAQMFAAAARFRISHRAVFAVRQHQVRVGTQRRQSFAIRLLETQPRQRNTRVQRMNLRRSR